MITYRSVWIRRASRHRPPRAAAWKFDVEDALEAALRVFWSKGYEGASLSELTEAMGITRPSLYAAFGNKESLFHKALDLYERDKLAYVSAALEKPSARGVAERMPERRLRPADDRLRSQGLPGRDQFGGLRRRGGIDQGRGAQGAARPPMRP